MPLQAAYVVANYKETQLTDVRPGQPVTIDAGITARHTNVCAHMFAGKVTSDRQSIVPATH